jgi:hypothetical protein
MVFCVVAGLNARVLAADAVHVGNCSQAEEICCSHSHGEAPDDHQHDGKKCPQDHHHHHGCCSISQPLTVENDHIRQPGIPGSSLLGMRQEAEVPPEEPFLSSEKPPLI